MKARRWVDSFYIKHSACTSNNRQVELIVAVAGKINLWLNGKLVFIKIVVCV